MTMERESPRPSGAVGDSSRERRQAEKSRDKVKGKINFLRIQQLHSKHDYW